jgi:methyltransferase (TIGR00027 family)
MMTQDQKMVGSTADGLAVIRSGQQAKQLGVEDPFAKWFITEEGVTLLQLAKKTDRVYEEYNLARYKFTTLKLRERSNQYRQMLFLGSGFDCRAIWLDVLTNGETTVFEIDEPAKLLQKKEQLHLHGVSVPDWNRYIPGNLANNHLPGSLLAEGLHPEQPLLVLAEGLFFFTPSNVAANLLNPKWLGLASGSRIIFDCWSDDRVNGLNARLLETMGRNLFHPFPYPTEPDKLKNELIALGYRHVTVTPLSFWVEGYYNHAILDEYKLGWLLVEALV